MYKIEERVNWIRERVEAANAKGVIVAISGGIDSAVTAALAMKAYPENSLGIFLDINSSQTSNRNYLRMVEHLGIKARSIDLTEDFESLVKSTFEIVDKYRSPEIYDHFLKTGEAPTDTSYLEADNIDMIKGNLKARLRMSVLYAVAQRHGYLVLETTNKSEDLIGYFTKWGDGAGDICPIADLWKSEVFGLAKELGLPEKVIETPPSADLWEGQTDEGELGFTYDNIEEYANGTLTDEAVKEKIAKMIKNNEHKFITYKFGGNN